MKGKFILILSAIAVIAFGFSYKFWPNGQKCVRFLAI